MEIKFTLTMKDLVLNGKRIDEVTMVWEDTIYHPEGLVEISREWITAKTFLTKRIEGLTRVGESSLSVDTLTL